MGPKKNVTKNILLVYEEMLHSINGELKDNIHLKKDLRDSLKEQLALESDEIILEFCENALKGS